MDEKDESQRMGRLHSVPADILFAVVAVRRVRRRLDCSGLGHAGMGFAQVLYGVFHIPQWLPT